VGRSLYRGIKGDRPLLSEGMDGSKKRWAVALYPNRKRALILTPRSFPLSLSSLYPHLISLRWPGAHWRRICVSVQSARTHVHSSGSSLVFVTSFCFFVVSHVIHIPFVSRDLGVTDASDGNQPIAASFEDSPKGNGSHQLTR
jgi:hypothetical protein